MRLLMILLNLIPLSISSGIATFQDEPQETKAAKKPRILYGIASFYADKFEGRETANGEVYRHDRLTAACNVLPLGTWIRVTNLKNDKFVIVKTNDRLHPRMKRIVDLSKSAAQKLAYIGRGLTQVKVEVLQKKPAVAEVDRDK
jgi:rare lipoprotein A